MSTHVNPVPALLGLVLLAAAWRLGVFDDAADRRAGLAACVAALLAIPVMEIRQLQSLPNAVQFVLVVGGITVVTVLVRFGGRLRRVVDRGGRSH
jgi:hypothetical protein